MKVPSLVLAGLGIALAGCGAAAPTLAIGPNHISETLGANSPDLTGTYKVTGEFMGEPSDGATLTIRKEKPHRQVVVERRFVSGELQARGVGIVDGDSLYVAWSTDELADLKKNDGTPLYFGLYVIALNKEGMEGVGGISSDVFSGTYGSSKPPAQLQGRESADYRTIHNTIFESHPVAFNLHVSRRGDRFYLGLSSDRGSAKFGTGVLAGSNKLVAVMLTEYEAKDTARVGVGVYKLAGDTVTGETVQLATAKDDQPDESGRMQTLLLPAVRETWTKKDATVTVHAEPPHLKSTPTGALPAFPQPPPVGADALNLSKQLDSVSRLPAQPTDAADTWMSSKFLPAWTKRAERLSSVGDALIKAHLRGRDLGLVAARFGHLEESGAIALAATPVPTGSAQDASQYRSARRKNVAALMELSRVMYQQCLAGFAQPLEPEWVELMTYCATRVVEIDKVYPPKPE